MLDHRLDLKEVAHVLRPDHSVDQTPLASTAEEASRTTDVHQGAQTEATTALLEDAATTVHRIATVPTVSLAVEQGQAEETLVAVQAVVHVNQQHP